MGMLPSLSQPDICCTRFVPLAYLLCQMHFCGALMPLNTGNSYLHGTCACVATSKEVHPGAAVNLLRLAFHHPYKYML